MNKLSLLRSTTNRSVPRPSIIRHTGVPLVKWGLPVTKSLWRIKTTSLSFAASRYRETILCNIRVTAKLLFRLIKTVFSGSGFHLPPFGQALRPAPNPNGPGIHRRRKLANS